MTLVPILLGLGVSRGVGAENLVGVAVPLALLSASTTAVSLLLLLVTAVSLNRANEDVQASRTRIEPACRRQHGAQWRLMPMSAVAIPT